MNLIPVVLIITLVFIGIQSISCLPTYDFLRYEDGNHCHEILADGGQLNWMEDVHDACFTGNNLIADEGWISTCDKFESTVNGVKMEYFVSSITNLPSPVKIYFGWEYIIMETHNAMMNWIFHWSCRGKNSKFLEFVEIQYDHSDTSDPTDSYAFVRVKTPNAKDAKCYEYIDSNTTLNGFLRLPGC